MSKNNNNDDDSLKSIWKSATYIEKWTMIGLSIAFLIGLFTNNDILLAGSPFAFTVIALLQLRR